MCSFVVIDDGWLVVFGHFREVIIFNGIRLRSHDVVSLKDVT